MAKYQYHYRVQANMTFNPNLVNMQPTEPALQRFTNLTWYGSDDEGNCVYRQDPHTGEILRIDFY